MSERSVCGQYLKRTRFYLRLEKNFLKYTLMSFCFELFWRIFRVGGADAGRTVRTIWRRRYCESFYFLWTFFLKTRYLYMLVFM